MLHHTAADYHDQLMALLPYGAAWPRSADTQTSRVMQALADALARVDQRLGDLVAESDPDTALEMLADWERLLGLPDPCLPADASLRARQRMAAQKLAARGGQSRAYLIQLAAVMGFEIEIEEYAPFVAGSLAGDELRNDDWAHSFLVRVLSSTTGPASWNASVSLSEFVAGSSAGEALRTFGNAVLECVLNRARPAHTTMIVGYQIDPEPTLHFDFLKGSSNAQN